MRNRCISPAQYPSLLASLHSRLERSPVGGRVHLVAHDFDVGHDRRLDPSVPREVDGHTVQQVSDRDVEKQRVDSRALLGEESSSRGALLDILHAHGVLHDPRAHDIVHDGATRVRLE